jgi:MFS family permease
MKSKSYRKFLLLWLGELISGIGGGLTSFGLGVYVFGLTGSAAAMTAVTLLAFLPTFVLSVPAGVLADKFDRRIMMMIGDGFSALGVIYILVCICLGNVTIYRICIGVVISSVFSSLLEPSYRASVTDILSADEYSRASGMVNLAGSARYLISPLIAGFLLTVYDVRLLLFIDICTFFVTVLCTGVVRKGLEKKADYNNEPFFKALKLGWKAISEKRGIVVLIFVSSLITCFMGVFQVLAEPLILSFSDSRTLGIGETVCACGMLASGIVLGVRGIKKNFVAVLILSLAFAGVFMSAFAVRENIYVICAAGFMFFATLPFANNCLDYLVRINIADELQGRAWGLIGFISQMGYVVAYGISGVLADYIGVRAGVGVGRGSAAVILVSGALLVITSLLLIPAKSVRALQKS